MERLIKIGKIKPRKASEIKILVLVSGLKSWTEKCLTLKKLMTSLR